MTPVLSIVPVPVVVLIQFGHDGHPVVKARARHAIGHDVTGPAVRDIAEFVRQLQ
jgi:hypothetical protein